MTKRRYDTPPQNLTSLEARLRNLVDDATLQNRARRQIGNIAVIAALTAHARDKNDQPLFIVKGGVAVELLMGLDARATKDLDAAVRAAAKDIRATPDFSPADVHEAARAVGGLIVHIDSAESRRRAIRATAGVLPDSDDWETWLAGVRGDASA